MTTPQQILFITRSRCTGCGTLSETSQLFSVDPLASGQEGRHFRPALTFFGSRTLEKVAHSTILTPVCHACPDSALAPTISDSESASRWALAVSRKKAQEKADRATAAKHIPTLDELL